MKNAIIPILVLMSFFVQGQTKRVLFLGNSYTFVNNLPQITSDIASSVGDTLIFEKNTPGGYTLQGHSSNATSLDLIMQGNWDFVVLQEQSQRPSLPAIQVEQLTFPYAQILDSIINENNPCGETMFFMTWGRKNGDASNCAAWPPVCTYEGMDSLLHLRYMMMADSNNAVVSPVGAVWHYIRDNYPGIELYSTDESHPSTAGSYAAACCFYTSVFRKDPLQITYDYLINTTDAANIRAATKVIVYDSLLDWHIGEYDLFSGFSYTQIDGLTYQFTNNSQNSIGQIWDFEVNTDTTSNPVFTFPDPGTYTVQLKTYDNCDTLISTDTIIATATGVLDTDWANKLKLFPNPANDILYIDIEQIDEITIDIYDILGGKIPGFNNSVSNEIDLTSLETGLYFIKISFEGKSTIRKIVKQ
jgi:hypothetical protein